MKAPILYRVAAVLLVLFSVGHTLGFRQSDPRWGTDPLLASMQSTRFIIQGFSRTYWDFFSGAGFIAGVLYLFAAVLAWQLGGLPAESLALLRTTRWAFASCFGMVAVLSYAYLFWIPIALSGLITLCLAAAATRGNVGGHSSV